MKISVAMGTYNGERYLREQLDSIAAQTRLPDELVITDDQSKDRTTEIVEAFASTVTFPVRLHINERNLGVVKNFEKAISLCEGDIIILSDQDDVCHPEKLRRTETEFVKSPGVGLVFSDLQMVGEDLQPLGYSAWESSYVEFSRQEKELFKKGRAFDVLTTRNVVTGAAMAFRSEFRELLLPLPTVVPNVNLLHDYSIALIISVVAKVTFIDDPLVKYRQHSEQQLGLSPPVLAVDLDPEAARKRDRYLSRQYILEIVLEQFRAKNTEGRYGEIIASLMDRIEHEQRRSELNKKTFRFRLWLALREVLTLRYHTYCHPNSNVWVEIAHDAFPAKLRYFNATVTGGFIRKSPHKS